MKKSRQEMAYHITQLEDLLKNVIEKISPEGRWRIFTTILKEFGVQEAIPYIFEKTGKHSRWAEDYMENLQEVLAFARASLDHIESGEPPGSVVGVCEVSGHEERALPADGRT